MKKCPFCAEEIQEEAVKCRFCGEFLEKPSTPTTKWYFATSTVVISLLCFGPIALPLVWLHPRYKKNTKLIITGLVIGLSILCCFLIGYTYNHLLKQIEALGMH